MLRQAPINDGLCTSPIHVSKAPLDLQVRITEPGARTRAACKSAEDRAPAIWFGAWMPTQCGWRSAPGLALIVGQPPIVQYIEKVLRWRLLECKRLLGHWVKESESKSVKRLAIDARCGVTAIDRITQ